MASFEEDRSINIAPSGRVTELYLLVQLGLENRGVEDDSYSRVAGFGNYDQASGLYMGYVDIVAINPRSDINRTGLCAVVSVGKLAEGARLNPQDAFERSSLEHLVTNYYIYHHGTRLVIAKNTNIIKPIEVDILAESEKLLTENDALQTNLRKVYIDELDEILNLLRGVLGYENNGKSKENEITEIEEKLTLKGKFINWLGRVGLK